MVSHTTPRKQKLRGTKITSWGVGGWNVAPLPQMSWVLTNLLKSRSRRIIYLLQRYKTNTLRGP
jgi:hypothetical protein